VKETVVKGLEESARVKRAVAETLADKIVDAAQRVIETYRAGGKVLLAGNGGSAADAQHIATELVGRFKLERTPLPAIALTTDTSLLTALANDYGHETVFRRQVEALGRRGDVLIAISTSGASASIIEAARAARRLGIFVIALTGQTGGDLKDAADLLLNVPSTDTARIQEAHITIAHLICQLVESELFR
jgi:D-sedoheptulose 7-phosphate isomerase